MLCVSADIISATVNTDIIYAGVAVRQHGDFHSFSSKLLGTDCAVSHIVAGACCKTGGRCGDLQLNCAGSMLCVSADIISATVNTDVIYAGVAVRQNGDLDFFAASQLAAVGAESVQNVGTCYQAGSCLLIPLLGSAGNMTLNCAKGVLAVGASIIQALAGHSVSIQIVHTICIPGALFTYVLGCDGKTFRSSQSAAFCQHDGAGEGLFIQFQRYIAGNQTIGCICILGHNHGFASLCSFQGRFQCAVCNIGAAGLDSCLAGHISDRICVQSNIVSNGGACSGFCHGKGIQHCAAVDNQSIDGSICIGVRNCNSSGLDCRAVVKDEGAGIATGSTGDIEVAARIAGNAIFDHSIINCHFAVHCGNIAADNCVATGNYSAIFNNQFC